MGYSGHDKFNPIPSLRRSPEGLCQSLKPNEIQNCRADRGGSDTEQVSQGSLESEEMSRKAGGRPSPGNEDARDEAGEHTQTGALAFLPCLPGSDNQGLCQSC